MNKFIVVLLSLLVAFIASDLLPEEAAERFLKSFKKHMDLKDADIFDQGYYAQVRTGNVTREQVIAFHFGENFDNGFKPHTALFTEDGFLKIKFYNKNKPSHFMLAKPNKNMEGGYILYRLVEY